MEKIIGFSLISLLFISTSFAQWNVNLEKTKDTKWRKSDGDFGAMLMFTDKPDELFEKWGKPGIAVGFSETEIAKRGEPIVAVVFFTGCAANDEGNCHSTVDFIVFKPDGSIYGEQLVGELWIDKPKPPERQLQLSVGCLGIVIEPEDPAGTYTVKAKISDKIAQKEMELVKSFRVEE